MCCPSTNAHGRYKGFSALLDSFRKIGLLQQTGKVEIERWEDLVPALMAAQLGVDAKSLQGEKLEQAIREMVGEAQATETIEALAWYVLKWKNVLIGQVVTS